MDASLIVYTGINLPYISVPPNTNLQVALQNINAAVNSMSPAPDYSGYNLGPYNGFSITETDGITHPTNTQNFAEGISKIVCIDEYNLAYFTGTTYVSDQSVITAAITAIQVPGLTYAVTAGGGSIAITSGMSLNQVLTATYTGVGSILNLLNAPGTTWASLSITTPTNISTAFDDLITYLGTLSTTVSGLQPLIGTFNNSANILTGGGGTSTDTIATTTALLITYTTNLPTFNPSGYTWGCVASQSTLDTTFQAILNTIASLGTNTVQASDSSIVFTPVGPCGGQLVGVNPAWAGLFNVVVDGTDTTPSSLLDKLLAGNGISLSVYNSGGNEKVKITNTAIATNQVAVNVNDTNPGFLQAKIPSTLGDWGLAISASPSADNSQLLLSVVVNDSTALALSLMDTISSNPALLAAWCNLQTQCLGCLCTAPGTLTVTFTTGPNEFNLSWSVGGSPTSQTVQYQPRGYGQWISNVNITSPNPQTNIATSAFVDNLDSNTVYQFQVESVCSGTTNGSNVYESIIFACQSGTIVCPAGPGVISVSQDPMMTVDNVFYRLKNNSSHVVLQNITATGANPIATFTAVATSITYAIECRMGATVNGVTVYSDDSSQLTSWCVIGTVTPA